ALCAGEPASVQAQYETKPPYRILVVDDDLDVRQLSADVLMSSGYEVDAAEDGEAGWEALHVNRYDLLITDNNMAKVTGMELIRKLRSAGMGLPVILASGAVPAEEPDRHSRLQLAAMMQKPFTSNELLEIVSNILGATCRVISNQERVLSAVEDAGCRPCRAGIADHLNTSNNLATGGVSHSSEVAPCRKNNDSSLAHGQRGLNKRTQKRKTSDYKPLERNQSNVF